MTCAAARELVESYLDGELDPSVQAEVEDHLTSCSSCAEKHAAYANCKRTFAPKRLTMIRRLVWSGVSEPPSRKRRKVRRNPSAAPGNGWQLPQRFFLPVH